jgi:hypothetical protein
MINVGALSTCCWSLASRNMRQDKWEARLLPKIFHMKFNRFTADTYVAIRPPAPTMAWQMPKYASSSCCKRAVSNCTVSAASSMRLSDVEDIAAACRTPGEKRFRLNPQLVFPPQDEFARKCPQT